MALVNHGNKKQIQLTPTQNEMLSYQGKIALARGGVGSGKSYLLCFWLIKRMMKYPKAQHFVFASDFVQIRKGFMRTFIGVLNELGIKYKYREDCPTITFLGNGAKLESASSEQADRVRSLEIDTLLMEECSSWPNGLVMFETLMSRVRKSPSGKLYPDMRVEIRGSFNPMPVGSWMWEKIEVQKSFPCFKLSTRDNFLMPDHAEYIDTLERSISPERWAVEIDGEWGNSGGTVVVGFDANIHTKVPHDSFPKLGEIDPKNAILWSLDFNVGNMASVIAQQFNQFMKQDGHEPQRAGHPPKPKYVPLFPTWQKRVIMIHDEIHLQDAGTPDVVEAFITKYGAIARRTGVILYGDAAGGARSQTMTSKSAVRSNWDIIIQGLQQAGIPYELRIQSNNPAVMDRINCTNAQVKTKDGPGLLISPNCKNVLGDISQLKFLQGKNEVDKRDLSKGHFFDAFSYLIWFEYQVAKMVVPKLQDFMTR